MLTTVGELAEEEGDALGGGRARRAHIAQTAYQVLVQLGGGGNVAQRELRRGGLERGAHRLEQKAERSGSAEPRADREFEGLVVRDHHQRLVHAYEKCAPSRSCMRGRKHARG